MQFITKNVPGTFLVKIDIINVTFIWYIYSKIKCFFTYLVPQINLKNICENQLLSKLELVILENRFKNELILNINY